MADDSEVTATARWWARERLVATAVLVLAVSGFAPAVPSATGASTASAVPSTSGASVAPSDCPPADAEPHGFADATGPHGGAIGCLTWLGIAEGRDATTFGTQRSVTRGQVASFVVRLLDRVDGFELPPAADDFSDVAGSPHAEAIGRLTALDPPVLRGYDDGSYRPQAPIQRGQAAAVIVRTHDHLAAALDEVPALVPAGRGFDDTAGSTHETDVVTAAGAGLVLGHEDGRFRPAAPITRGQTASVLVRHLGILADAGVVPALDDPEDADDPEDPEEPPPTGNVWRDERRVLNFAHAGGDHEAPQNTLYALRTAADRGADALEIDLHITADGHVVVIHDSTVDRTTSGTGCVIEHTLDELQALDAAHWHVDGEGPRTGRADDAYPHRGIATGDVAPPEGFTAADFRVPTLAELFEAEPHAIINMDLKPTEEETRGEVTHDCPAARAALGDDAPDLVAETARLIEAYDAADRVMVASFQDETMARFKALAPHIDTSFPLLAAIQFYVVSLTGVPGIAPNPDGHVALQVPMLFDLPVPDELSELIDLLSLPDELTDLLDGLLPVTHDLRAVQIDQDFVEYAHGEGIAVHVWTINDADDMATLLDWDVDGIITDEVRQLDQLMRDRDVPRPPR